MNSLFRWLLVLFLASCTSSSPFADSPDSTEGDSGQEDLNGPPPESLLVEAVVDREYRDAIVGLIASADDTVDLFQFEFIQSGSAVSVRNALIAAANRGVSVRVFLDEEPEDNVTTVNLLSDAGVTARIHKSDTRLHIKILVVDNETVLVGSTNLSGASLDFNHETNVLTRSPGAIAFLSDYLDRVWNNPDHDPDVVTTDPDSTAVTVWVDGGYLSLVLPVLTDSPTRVDAIVYGINLNPKYPDGPVMELAQTLYGLVKSGVPVRVLFERSQWNEILNDLNDYAAKEFIANGIQVRYDTKQIVTHAKLLLVDDTAFVGTNNWGYAGLELAHEAGLMFKEPGAVAKLDSYFEARWAESQAP